ncbi:MAG: 6,7-dimethyl-8-ribityllumazine synthase [Kiritimatiellae bacterium]|nr:6,7-dimethyl-8-ribityllumazine synthase [Kiritimatiellia bacterium]
MAHIKGEAKELASADLGGVAQVSGSMNGEGLRIGIVVSRFNESLTTELARTAIAALEKHGVRKKDILVHWVPGAYEVPAVIHKLALEKRFDALIALGVVIEGETPHADLINAEVAHYLAKTSRRCGVPVIHEVVGTRNIGQAVARCTSGETSRGWYAGCAAVEMATLYRAMEKRND